MGLTTWPCPTCGQAQVEEHDNGKEVARRLCAACKEKQKEEGGSEDAFIKKHRH